MLNTTFEAANKQFDQRKNTSSVLVTLFIHGLIFLLLIFVVLRTPIPPFEDNDGGVAVNFGTSDVGTGDVQPMTLTPIQADFSAAPSSASAPAANEEIVTQDIEDAPVIEEKSEPKKNPSPTAVPTNNTKPSTTNVITPPQPQVNKDALFNPGAMGKPNNSKGDGQGGGVGDQGDPNGDPNSKSYEGNGWGDGSGPGGGSGIGDGNVKLTGRKTLLKAEPVYNSQARGKVVIEISVNRAGQVVSAKYTPLGSTTSDNLLVGAAIDAARKFRFDENSNAAEIQKGTILFNFVKK